MKDKELEFLTDRYCDVSEVENFWNEIVDGLNLRFCVDSVQREADGWLQAVWYCSAIGGYNIVIDNDFPPLAESVDDIIRIIDEQNKTISEIEAKLK